MQKNKGRFQFNIDKMVLSSKSVYYKTESLIKETRFFSGIDFLLTKICDNILLHLDDICGDSCNLSDDLECCSVTIDDNMFCFYFKFGYQMKKDFNKFDLIVFDCEIADRSDLKETIVEYVKKRG